MSDSKKKGKRRADAGKSAPKTPEERKREMEVQEAEASVSAEPEPVTEIKPAAQVAKPATPRKKRGGILGKIEMGILIFGFLVMFASMLWMDFRNVVAHAVDLIVSPFTSTMPFYIMVLAIAAIVALFSTFIQKYTMDWDLMRQITEKNRVIQKEMREAQLSGNKAKIKKLQDEQMAGMSEQMEINKMQFKPMGFLAIISVPLFIWAWWYLSLHPHISMVFPFAGQVELATGGFLFFPWWVIWSILCSMAISQVIRKAFNVGIAT